MKNKNYILFGILLLVVLAPMVLALDFTNYVSNALSWAESNPRIASAILFLLFFLPVMQALVLKMGESIGWGDNLRNAKVLLGLIFAVMFTWGIDVAQTQILGYYLIPEFAWVFLLITLVMGISIFAYGLKGGGKTSSELMAFLICLGIVVLYHILERFVNNFPANLGGWGDFVDFIYGVAAIGLVIIILLFLWNTLVRGTRVTIPDWLRRSRSPPGTQPGTQPGNQPGTQPRTQPGTQPGNPPGTPPPTTPQRRRQRNSNYVPVMGLWQVAPGAVNVIVAEAIRAGYVEFDTSDNYGNEAELAVAVRSYPVRTVYTKIDPDEYSNIVPAIQNAQRLFGGVRRLIIMLHWPGQTTIGGTVVFPGADGLAAYRELARLANDASVSNFGIDHLREISRIQRPYLNQIEINPLLQQTEIINYCRTNGIQVQAFSPLASGRLDTNRTVLNIANQYGKSVAQVLIRYAFQKGADIVNIKTTNPQRMQENLDINNFQLSRQDMAQLDSLRDDAAYPLGTSGNAPSPQVFPPFPLPVNPPRIATLARLGNLLRRQIRRIRNAARNLINTP